MPIFIRKTIRRLFYWPSKYLCKLLLLSCDKGPFENTTFPIGWISKGYKKGEVMKKNIYESKKDFISKNVLKSDLVSLTNDIITIKDQ